MGAGVNVISMSNSAFNGLNVFNVVKARGAPDKDPFFAVEFKDTSVNVSYKNSIVAGGKIGFKAPGYSCADTPGQSKSNNLLNNVAHSYSEDGMLLIPDPGVASGACIQGSHFKSYKNGAASVAA